MYPADCKSPGENSADPACFVNTPDVQICISSQTKNCM